MLQLQVFTHGQDENEPASFIGYVSVPEALLWESGMIEEVADQLGIDPRGLSFREIEDGSVVLLSAGKILYSMEEVLLDTT
jgi:hypothetical protein